MTAILVIGAAGDVGRGIVAAALDRGWEVTGAGRDLARLEAVAEAFPELATAQADISDRGGVDALIATVGARWDAVAVAVNPGGWIPVGLLESAYEATRDHLDTYLRAHLACAAGFVPRLPTGAAFVGIGGGMADAAVPGMGPVSMAQAAQRMAYRHLAREARQFEVRVREVIVHSMVAGVSNRASADPGWISDTAIGATVCDLVDETEARRDPIVDLRP